MNFAVKSLLLVASSLPLSASAQFIISNPGTQTSSLAGQNFSPSVDPTPNPGLTPTSQVFLSNFTFNKGFDATTSGNANTVLVILQGAYPDLNGDPNGSYIPNVSNVTGVSTNTVDTTTSVFGAPLSFNFNSLAMNYGDNYTAAFATVGAGGVLNFISLNALYAAYADIGGGVYRPVTNYGGGPTVANPSASANYNASALYGPPSASGFFGGDSFAADAAFSATFNVPEPAAVSIGALALGALTTRRRR